MRRKRRRTGAVLLEVMAGTLILGLSGMAWVALMGQTMHDVSQMRRREATYRAAADDLQLVALWTPGQLDAATGTHPVGSYLLTVQPLGAALFDVVLADSAGVPLLTTSIYTGEYADTATD